MKCDMEKTCTATVTHIDNRAFVYCTHHGLQRRAGGTPCRKMRAWEKHEMTLSRFGRPIGVPFREIRYSIRNR